MNEDITTLLLEFREARRNLWNTYFWGRISSVHDPRLDHFESIERELFECLVLLPATGKGLQGRRFRDAALDEIEIISETRKPTRLILAVEPTPGVDRVWDDAGTVVETPFSGRFIEFFEWDRYGCVSFALLRMRLDSTLPIGLRDREALVDVADVRARVRQS